MKAIQAKALVGFCFALVLSAVPFCTLGHAEDFDPITTEAAAKSGDAEAEYLMARAFETGEGVSRDEAKALTYYKRSAEHGNVKAQNNLASLYATGTGGVAKDEARAEKWLRKAAEQGATLAQDNLGLLLGRRNDTEAVRWFEKSARQGLLSAQLHLGAAYYDGKYGTEQNYHEAATWLRKAAAQKSGWAGNVLGVMYQNGLGVVRDQKEALRFFHAAAELGDPKAQSNLGQMYCTGSGVETNPAEGFKWLSLSAEQNEITAIKFLADFQTVMTPRQIEAGEKLVQLHKAKLEEQRSR